MTAKATDIVGCPALARRTNTFLQALERLPHRAVIRRTEMFFRADRAELDAAVKEIAAGTEWYSFRGSRGDESNFTVIRFTTVEKAAAMQRWIEKSMIETRPIPKHGRTAEEEAELKRIALDWGQHSGAIRAAVQTYLRHRADHDPEGPSMFHAAMAIRQLGPPSEEWHLYAGWYMAWARANHPEWFRSES